MKRLYGHQSWLFLRVVVGMTGVVMSVLAHEAVHAALHVGNIAGVQFLPSSGTIMELTLRTPIVYDVRGEEAAAYLVTVIVLFVTAAVISRMHDSHVDQTVQQLIFNQEPTAQSLSPRDVAMLAYRAGILER